MDKEPIFMRFLTAFALESLANWRSMFFRFAGMRRND